MKMMAIEEKPTLIGGESENGILDSLEEFVGMEWSLRGTFETGGFQYLMPSTLPEQILSCNTTKKYQN
jgi:hypothetical protein